MLIINIGMTAYQYRNNFANKANEIRDVKQNLIDVYLTDNTEYNNLYSEYQKRLSYYNAQYYSMLNDDNTKSMPVFENVLVDYPDYGDRQLFKEVEEIINAQNNYSQALNSLLRDTAARIKDTDNRDSYTYKYYIQLINNYDPLTGKTWDIAEINGWNEFFSLETPSVFIALASLGLFCGVFTVDWRASFSNVLNISKRGRGDVRRAKLEYITISSAILTVAYTLAPLTIFAFSCGFSSADMPIQALDGFKYCRFEFTVGQYLVIYLLVRILLFICFSLTVAVIGQYAKSEIPAFIFTVILTVASIILKNISPESIYYNLQKFNAIDIFNINILFTQLRGINIFNSFIDYTFFILIAAAAIIVIIICLSMLKKPSCAVVIIKGKETNKTTRISMSLLNAECYKILVCEAGIYIIIASIILKVILSGIYYSPNTGVIETLYMDYISQLKGPVTEEILL